MLLVDDEQAQPVDGREDGRACAHDEVDLAPPDAIPLIVPLAVGQAAVLNGHAVAEGRPELRGDLWRQRDLRHEDQHTAALRDGVTGEAHVQLGLAAAGDAVHQRRMVAAAIEQARQRRERRRLLLRQRARFVTIDGRRGDSGKRVPLAHFLAQVHEPAVREASQRAKVDAVLAKRTDDLGLAGSRQRRQGRLLACAQRRLWRDALCRRKTRARRGESRDDRRAKRPGAARHRRDSLDEAVAFE